MPLLFNNDQKYQIEDDKGDKKIEFKNFCKEYLNKILDPGISYLKTLQEKGAPESILKNCRDNYISASTKRFSDFNLPYHTSFEQMKDILRPLENRLELIAYVQKYEGVIFLINHNINNLFYVTDVDNITKNPLIKELELTGDDATKFLICQQFSGH